MRATVRRRPDHDPMWLLDRILFAIGLLLTMLLIGIQLARAAEVAI